MKYRGRLSIARKAPIAPTDDTAPNPLPLITEIESDESDESDEPLNTKTEIESDNRDFDYFISWSRRQGYNMLLEPICGMLSLYFEVRDFHLFIDTGSLLEITADNMKAGIINSNNYIILLSPSTYESEWCILELYYIIKQIQTYPFKKLYVLSFIVNYIPNKDDFFKDICRRIKEGINSSIFSKERVFDLLIEFEANLNFDILEYFFKEITDILENDSISTIIKQLITKRGELTVEPAAESAAELTVEPAAESAAKASKAAAESAAEPAAKAAAESAAESAAKAASDFKFHFINTLIVIYNLYNKSYNADVNEDVNKSLEGVDVTFTQQNGGSNYSDNLKYTLQQNGGADSTDNHLPLFFKVINLDSSNTKIVTELESMSSICEDILKKSYSKATKKATKKAIPTAATEATEAHTDVNHLRFYKSQAKLVEQEQQEQLVKQEQQEQLQIKPKSTENINLEEHTKITIYLICPDLFQDDDSLLSHPLSYFLKYNLKNFTKIIYTIYVMGFYFLFQYLRILINSTTIKDSTLKIKINEVVLIKNKESCIDKQPLIDDIYIYIFNVYSEYYNKFDWMDNKLDYNEFNESECTTNQIITQIDSLIDGIIDDIIDDSSNYNEIIMYKKIKIKQLLLKLSMDETQIKIRLGVKLNTLIENAKKEAILIATKEEKEAILTEAKAAKKEAILTATNEEKEAILIEAKAKAAKKEAILTATNAEKEAILIEAKAAAKKAKAAKKEKEAIPTTAAAAAAAVVKAAVAAAAATATEKLKKKNEESAIVFMKKIKIFETLVPSNHVILTYKEDITERSFSTFDLKEENANHYGTIIKRVGKNSWNKWPSNQILLYFWDQNVLNFQHLISQLLHIIYKGHSISNRFGNDLMKDYITKTIKLVSNKDT